jgi:large subunit ribosomal protein L10
MSKAVRSRIVDTYTSRYQGLKAMVLVDFKGLTSAQASSLRSTLRADKIQMTVLKNSSAQRAFTQMGWKDLAPLVNGPTAVVFGIDDPILISKRIVTWRQKNKVLEIRGGCIEGRAVPPAEIAQLAQMPGREQILGGVVAAVQSPMTSLVNTCQGVIRDFVGTVDAIVEKQKSSGGDS